MKLQFTFDKMGAFSIKLSRLLRVLLHFVTV